MLAAAFNAVHRGHDSRSLPLVHLTVVIVVVSFLYASVLASL